MQWIKLALAGASITGLGACGTINRLTEPPLPIVVTQPIIVPAECRVEPVTPRETSEPTLLPENVTSPVEATRNQLANARLAFLFWQDRANAVEEAYDVNAATQRACGAWARRQDQ
jgi:hypothetical protein